MITLTRTKAHQAHPSLEARPAARSGPVPLDPALLVHVAGGSGAIEQAPHGRWSPIEQDVGEHGSAPHGRW